jgi:hypothetical protein
MFPSALTTRHWKKAEAERIVAGQPVHALLSEQQHGVEFSSPMLAVSLLKRAAYSSRSKCRAMGVLLDGDGGDLSSVIGFVAVGGAAIGIPGVSSA